MQGALAVQPAKRRARRPSVADIAAPAQIGQIGAEPVPASALVAANGSTPGPANDTAPDAGTGSRRVHRRNAGAAPVPDLTAAVGPPPRMSPRRCGAGLGTGCRGRHGGVRASTSVGQGARAAGLQARIASHLGQRPRQQDAACPLTARGCRQAIRCRPSARFRRQPPPRGAGTRGPAPQPAALAPMPARTGGGE